MGLQAPPYLSPSSIGTFQTCPLQYKFSKIDKLPDPPTEATTLGNFVHDVLEELHKLPVELKTLQTAKELLKSKHDSEWREKIEDILFDKDALKAFRWKALWCIENYFKIEDPKVVPVGGVETPLLTDPTDETSFVKIAGVPIKGFIDRWDDHGDTVHIVDYKTGKTPKPRYEEPKFQQLAIYADAISQIAEKPASKMTLLFIKDGTPISREVTDKRLNEMRSTVSEIWDNVNQMCEDEEFPATPNVLCGWCAFKPVCPAWK